MLPSQQTLRRPSFASCDGVLRPFAYDCVQGRFDFTFLFEQAFFRLMPSVLLLFIALFRYRYLAQQKRKVLGGSILHLKIALCAVLGFLHFATLMAWTNLSHDMPAKTVATASSVLATLASLTVTALVIYEHSRSVQPSTTLTVYLLLSTMLDGICCRTVWLIDNLQPLTTLYGALSSTNLLLLILECQDKRLLLLKQQDPSPEATSGILSRSFLWWLNSLFATGYKTTLATENLYALDEELQSKTLLLKMQVNWRAYKHHGKRALLWTLLKSTRDALLVGIAPRIFFSLCKMSQPFLIKTIILTAQKQIADEGSNQIGLVLIPLTSILYLGNAVSNSLYTQKTYRLLTALKGSLTSFVLVNMTDLHQDAKESSAVLTLITTDVGKITQVFKVFHEFWATVIELGLALWFLGREMGVGSLGPAIAVFCSFCGISCISKAMGNAVKANNEATQERIGYTSKVLGYMKETKMLGLVDFCTSIIDSLHDKQMRKSATQRRLSSTMNLLGNTPSRLAPVLTFGIALLAFGSRADGHFTLAKAFTSISILGLVTGPLAWLMYSIPDLFGSFASFSRLQDFILACENSKMCFQDPDDNSQNIGSKGLSLSGGQKQRIALARAIYPKNSVVIIDDVLSGLDWSTQRLVWNQVFGPSGILRTTNITIILATHALHLVNDEDNVILLGDNYPGHVQQATLGEHKEQTQIQTLILAVQNLATEDENEQAKKAVVADQTFLTATKKPANKDLKPANRRCADFSLYFYYLRTIGWKWLAVFATMQVANVFANIFPQIWLVLWTSEGVPNWNMSSWWYYGIYSLGQILSLILYSAQTWVFLVDITPKSVRVLHSKLLHTVMQAPLSFFVATDLGDLVNRFSKDHGILNHGLPVSVLIFSEVLLSFLGSITLVLAGSRYLFACLPVLLIVLYVVQKFYLRTSRQLRQLDLEASAPLCAHVLEVIDGISTLHAFGWVSEFQDASLKLLDESLKPHYFLLSIQCWLKLVLELFVGALATILVALVLIVPVEETNAGGVALGITNILNLSSSVVGLITLWVSLQGSLGALERLRLFEENTPTENNASTNDHDLPAKWPAHGAVKFAELTVSYSSKSSGTKPAVRDISISIQPGQKLAICGRTGSGKSTLLLTLLRLVNMEQGSITIDGIDISHISPNKLRSSFISVPQEPTFFPGSIRTNIRPGCERRGAADPSIMSCLDKVGLWEGIKSQNGLDTDVSDMSFSHGQKQLLSLARALAQKDRSAILLLDEAMSAVDQHTEELMTNIIHEEFIHHTVISVVHRLNTICDYDQVVVLDDGVIVESGKPRDLLRTPGSRFCALWNRDS